MPPTVFKTKNEDNIKLDVKNRISFMYSEFACIVDYLVEKYGKEKLLVYMKNLTKGNDHDTIFRQIYGTDFERMLVDFRQYVLLNAQNLKQQTSNSRHQQRMKKTRVRCNHKNLLAQKSEFQ